MPPAAEIPLPPSSSAPAPQPAKQPAKQPRAPRLSMQAWRQFWRVARPYWAVPGEQRRAAWTLLAALVVLMLAETQFAVMLNNQAGEMTSALSAHERDRFWSAVRDCLITLAFAVPIYAFYYYMRDLFSLRWRKWLTGRFLGGYLGERRYYALGGGGAQEIDNPDQRISEDINNFTGRSIHYLLIFVGSLMQLVAFSAVLWSISQTLVGFLVVYAFVGTVVALRVFGQPLIKLNFWQVRREADFRFGLMRVRENAESIAFYRGEDQERMRIDAQLDAACDNYARLIRGQRSLNLFQRAFSQLTIVIPSIILAEQVLSGELEVGRAVQAAGAFAAVLGAVSLIVDNFDGLARFVAGIDRLHAMAVQLGLLKPKGPGAGPLVKTNSISRKEGAQLVIEGLTLHTPGGERLLIKDLNLRLAEGEGLLITGPSGCGKSSLLRAIAGLWGSGSGSVEHPSADQVLFLPQRPYMHPGSLRSQILYPGHASKPPGDERLLEILAEVQLPNLAERVGGLDAEQDWEKLLSIGEQQRLAFARVLAHEPRTVILDEATSALDTENEAALYQRLRDEGITLVSIAHREALASFHARVLKLKGDGDWELEVRGG